MNEQPFKQLKKDPILQMKTIHWNWLYLNAYPVSKILAACFPAKFSGRSMQKIAVITLKVLKQIVSLYLSNVQQRICKG